MFIIFGDKHRTEPLPGGITRTMKCTKCLEVATFRERVISKQFRLYFIEMFTHGTHHVLECGACGTTFVTDELKEKAVANDHSGTVFGALQDLARKGKELATSDETRRALEQTGAGIGKALGTAQERVGGLISRLQKRGDDKDE